MKWIAVILTAVSMMACSSDNTKSNATCGAGAVGSCRPGVAGKLANQTDYPNVANTIYGAWQADKTMTDNGITFQPILYFAQDGKFAISMLCFMPNQTLAVTAESFAQVDNTQIQFPSVPKTSFEHNGDTCEVAVAPSSAVYVVTGNKLRMTSRATGETGTFSRMNY